MGAEAKSDDLLRGVYPHFGERRGAKPLAAKNFFRRHPLKRSKNVVQ